MSKSSRAKAKGVKAKSKLKRAKSHAKKSAALKSPRRYVPSIKEFNKRYKKVPSRKSKIA